MSWQSRLQLLKRPRRWRQPDVFALISAQINLHYAGRQKRRLTAAPGRLATYWRAHIPGLSYRSRSFEAIRAWPTLCIPSTRPRPVATVSVWSVLGAWLRVARCEIRGGNIAQLTVGWRPHWPPWRTDSWLYRGGHQQPCHCHRLHCFCVVVKMFSYFFLDFYLWWIELEGSCTLWHHIYIQTVACYQYL